jgi:hypothetical protein
VVRSKGLVDHKVFLLTPGLAALPPAASPRAAHRSPLAHAICEQPFTAQARLAPPPTSIKALVLPATRRQRRTVMFKPKKGQHMTTRLSTFHRGYLITTRCEGAAHNRFEASFTVSPPSCADACWQRFPRCSFATADAATHDALGVAIALVDQACLGG